VSHGTRVGVLISVFVGTTNGMRVDVEMSVEEGDAVSVDVPVGMSVGVSSINPLLGGLISKQFWQLQIIYAPARIAAAIKTAETMMTMLVIFMLAS
jgi:hypothetical protein